MADADVFLSLRGSDTLDYTATSRPRSTVIKITITYQGKSNEAESAIWGLQRAHAALKAAAAERRSGARTAAREAGTGRKPSRRPNSIGRDAPPLMIPYFPPEDEA